MSDRVAVMLAGGKGTRLLPYTLIIPKPLVAIGEYPIAEILVMQLKRNGFTDVYMAVNHQANLIRDYFGDGSKYGIKIHYYLEKKPLGTMGPLTVMKEDLPDDFLVMNGDVLTDLSFSSFFERHRAGDAFLTVSGKRRTEIIDYGVLHVNAEGTLVDFEEKPTISHVMSMGVYGLKKKTLSFIPEDTYFGFDTLVRALLADQREVHVAAYDGYWNDIGRPSDYQQAIDDFEKMKERFLS